MLQDALFYDNVWDALKAIVERAGGNQIVGLRLRPTKNPIEAGKWLSNVLNPMHHEKPDVEDVLALLRIGHEVGFHGCKWWIDADTGYGTTGPLNDEDQEGEYLRVVASASNELRRATDAIERMRGKRAGRK